MLTGKRQTFPQMVALALLLIACKYAPDTPPLEAQLSSVLSSVWRSCCLLRLGLTGLLRVCGVSAVMVNWQSSSGKEGSVSGGRGALFYSGVVAVLAASFLSGLSAAVTEKVLQASPHATQPTVVHEALIKRHGPVCVCCC